MLKNATFTNLTSVPAEKWEFCSGINIIVGENGLGKSHVLKAIYSLLRAQTSQIKPSSQVKPTQNTYTIPYTKSGLERRYAEVLVANMRAESLGRLVKRKQGRARCEIKLVFKDNRMNTHIAFATQAKTQVEVIQMPNIALIKPPVMLPTRELVTLCPWFLPLYENYNVEFEQSWRDTVSLLGAPTLRGPTAHRTKALLAPIEQAMGGSVEVDNKTGRFYLHVNGGRMEMPLVAEGLRKFAMLARLVSTGVLLEQGYLFWDEPETNLNPKLIKIVAQVIVALADQGIQTFIASHSLFLLRELEMLTDLSSNSNVKSRYFALAAVDGEAVSRLEQGDRVDDLKALVLLDEEMLQADRFMELD